MIKVIFEFDSIEKAVATLGSLMQKGAPVPTLANPAAPAPVEKKSNRKPRADAGKPRGAYKNVATAGTGSVPLANQAASGPPTVATPETAAPTVDQQQSMPSGGSESVAAVPATEAEAQTALTALFNAKGLAVAQATLGKFGVQALRHLPADKRGEFIAAANEAAK